MKEQRINGFEMSQIFNLYDFLVAYEDSGIQKYRSTKAMLSEHPELSDIENIAKKVKYNKANSQKMTGLDFKSFTNEIYQTKNKHNNMLSFLAHLRDSIAHGYAQEHGGKVLITDFDNPKYNPIDFSARGCVDFQLIKELTKTIKLIEL